MQIHKYVPICTLIKCIFIIFVLIPSAYMFWALGGNLLADMMHWIRGPVGWCGTSTVEPHMPIYFFSYFYGLAGFILGTYLLFLPDQKMREQRRPLLILLLLSIPLQLILLLLGGWKFFRLLAQLLEPANWSEMFSNIILDYEPITLLGAAGLLIYQQVRLWRLTRRAP